MCQEKHSCIFGIPKPNLCASFKCSYIPKLLQKLSIIPEAEFWHANTAAEKDEAASFFIEGKGDLGMKSRATGSSVKSDFDGKRLMSTTQNPPSISLLESKHFAQKKELNI